MRFSPEFLNRIDDIILFNRLSRENISMIVKLQEKEVQDLLSDRKIKIEIDDKAREWLAQNGYDPIYGARPIKRLFQHEIHNPLASLLLEGKIRTGGSVVITFNPSTSKLEFNIIEAGSETEAPTSVPAKLLVETED
jgi:ATP-dependent Clp protease ATP-binding subunit ClpB